MKNNEKGLTLIELLATITLLSIVVISVVYIFTNFQNTARQHKVSSDAVNAARIVLEELKWSLPKSEISEITLFEDNQTLNLTGFRNPNQQPYTSNQLYFPSSNNNKYEINISTEEFEKSLAYNTEIVLDLEQYFRHITIELIDSKTGSTIYSLQSYIEYNN